MTDSDHYQAYLIRLQRTNGRLSWRTTLENVHTGEVLRFGTEQELLRYLQQSFVISKNDGSKENL